MFRSILGSLAGAHCDASDGARRTSRTLNLIDRLFAFDLAFTSTGQRLPTASSSLCAEQRHPGAWNKADRSFGAFSAKGMPEDKGSTGLIIYFFGSFSGCQSRSSAAAWGRANAESPPLLAPFRLEANLRRGEDRSQRLCR